MNSKSQNETLFWKKKEYVSFVLSILVLFIHSYFAPTVLNDSFISLFNHKFSFFFSRSITRYAVPMFFMLSGISFFKGYNQKNICQKSSPESILWLSHICYGIQYGCFGKFSLHTRLFQNSPKLTFHIPLLWKAF